MESSDNRVLSQNPFPGSLAIGPRLSMTMALFHFFTSLPGLPYLTSILPVGSTLLWISFLIFGILVFFLFLLDFHFFEYFSSLSFPFLILASRVFLPLCPPFGLLGGKFLFLEGRIQIIQISSIFGNFRIHFEYLTYSPPGCNDC